MSSEIMLATSYNPDKITFPVEVSVKLDGVAADFYKTPDGWVCQSRQGKPLPSTAHIVRYLNHKFPEVRTNSHIVGELTVMGEDDFKTAAGVIRRHEPDPRITLNVYDLYIVGLENETYERRIDRINRLLERCTQGCFYTDGNVTWTFIRRVPVEAIANNMAQLQNHLTSVEEMMGKSGLFEGLVIRCLRGTDSMYKIGKRSRGMMKYKPKPTVDLRVIGFEEATANKTMTFLGENFFEGDGLKAVGGIICEYKDGTTKAGPGCLTHIERRTIWEAYLRNDKKILDNVIAEIEYMLDPSYDKLRQPVFKRWRPDKSEPSEVV